MKLLVIIVLLVAMLFIFGPQGGSPPAESPEQQIRNSRALAAMVAVKSGLRNRNSVQWDSVTVNSDASLVCIKYRAQNGFGGMASERVLYRDGIPTQERNDWLALCDRTQLIDMSHVALLLPNN